MFPVILKYIFFTYCINKNIYINCKMHNGSIFWSFFTLSRCEGKVIALVHARVSITRCG